MSDHYKKFRVFMHSSPGIGWEFYRGKVDVFADDTEQAIDRAKQELKRGAFPDRPSSSWIVERVESQS